MPNLYELSGARLELQKKLESMNFDNETIQDTLEAESSELQAKIEDYGFVIRNRESFANAIKAEIDRLQARLLAENNRIANIENWLLTNMVGCGINKIECPAFTIAVQNNTPSVDVIDEALIPTEFMRIPEPKPPVPVPDKKAIISAIKSGLSVSGCSLKQIQRLVIK